MSTQSQIDVILKEVKMPVYRDKGRSFFFSIKAYQKHNFYIILGDSLTAPLKYFGHLR